VQRGQRLRGASIAYGVELCWAVKTIARAMPLPAAQWSDEHGGQNYGRATRKTSAEQVVAAGGQSDERRNARISQEPDALHAGLEIGILDLRTMRPRPAPRGLGAFFAGRLLGKRPAAAVPGAENLSAGS
jgi:hypothetical protein